MGTGRLDTAVVFGSRVAALVLGVAVQSILAWLLGPGGRGAYAVCLLYGTVLAAVFSFGLDRAGQYYVASGRMSLAVGVRATALALLASSLVGMVVGRLLMESGAEFFDRAPREAFYLSLVLIPVVMFHNAFVALLVGLRRLGQMAVASITNVAMQLVGVLVLVPVAGMGVRGALSAAIVAGAGSAVVSWRFLARNGAAAPGRVGLGEIRRLVSYGIRYFVAKLSSVLEFRTGVMVLAFLVPATEIGLFAAASSLLLRVTLVPDAVSTALVSRVAGDDKGHPALVARAARVTVLIVGPTILALALLGGPIVTVLLSPRFVPSVPLVRIMAVGVFVRAATKVLTTYFVGTGRPAICSWAVGVGTVVNVAGILLFLPVVGLRGAAWAMTLGYLVSGAVFALAFRRASGLGLREAWAIRREDLAALADISRSFLQKVGAAFRAC